MTVAPHDLLVAADRFVGQPYNQGPGRTDPRSGYKDCSGLIVASLAEVGIVMAPGFAPVSTGLELWCRSVATIDGRGLGRSLAEAYNTPACLLFVWGYGDNGHVAFSTGTGNGTWETPIHPCHCVGAREAKGRSWTGAALIPGVDYSAVAPPVPPFVIDPDGFLAGLAKKVAWLRVAVRRRPIKYGDNNQAVVVVQLELTAKGIDCGGIDGAFGPKTLTAVQFFQATHALVADGIVGPRTFAALTA